MACGEIGLGVAEFYSLTWRQFDNIAKGHYQRWERDKQDQWSQTRMLMWAALLPHQKKGKELAPEDIMKFPWETETKTEQLSEEETLKQLEEAKTFWKRQDLKKNKK